MADLTLPVHGKMVTFEDVPMSEIDHLIAAVPRKEKELGFDEVVAYLTKKYSKTGKRKKEPTPPPPPPTKAPGSDTKVIKIRKKK